MYNPLIGEQHAYSEPTEVMRSLEGASKHLIYEKFFQREKGRCDPL